MAKRYLRYAEAVVSHSSDVRILTLVLTVVAHIEAESRANEVQIGFAELPKVGKELHMAILRGWLDDCDDNHDDSCRPPKDGSTPTKRPIRLPTRLISVGVEGDPTVKLQTMHPDDEGDWIALSYRWGPPPYTWTTRQNLSSHMSGMVVATLPCTFQHAIKVTRALRHKYLWIDSICIIQGDDGDFSDEYKRMEDVYSGAYCVLAASCATDQQSGFLLPRVNRQYVAVGSKDGGGGSIYVCEMIDNFRDDVLQGALNKRGWVLQEHALARRTIFFTEHQTYWECGYGVRCETMTRMTK